MFTRSVRYNSSSGWPTAGLAEEEGIAHRKPASINATFFERRARELHEQIFGS